MLTSTKTQQSTANIACTETDFEIWSPVSVSHLREVDAWKPFPSLVKAKTGDALSIDMTDK